MIKRSIWKLSKEQRNFFLFNKSLSNDFKFFRRKKEHEPSMRFRGRRTGYKKIFNTLLAVPWFLIAGFCLVYFSGAPIAMMFGLLISGLILSAFIAPELKDHLPMGILSHSDFFIIRLNLFSVELFQWNQVNAVVFTKLNNQLINIEIELKNNTKVSTKLLDQFKIDALKEVFKEVEMKTAFLQIDFDT